MREKLTPVKQQAKYFVKDSLQRNNFVFISNPKLFL